MTSSQFSHVLRTSPSTSSYGRSRFASSPAPAVVTYGDIAEPTWHASRKDDRRKRMEISRRKLMHSLSR